MKTITRDELEAAIVAYGEGRRRVRAAMTKPQFLSASADLWEAERHLNTLAARLAREPRTERIA